MKKLILLVLLVPYLTAAQDFGRSSKVPEKKFEISLLAGKAMDLTHLPKIIGSVEKSRIYFTGVNVYFNIRRTQLGFGIDLEPTKYDGAEKYRIPYVSPHIVINRTLETENFSFYAGGMIGYIRYDGVEYDAISHAVLEDYGNGIVGGLQGGVIFKLDDYTGLNVELALRGREIKHRYVSDLKGPLYGQPSSQSYIREMEFGRFSYYAPIRLGFRFRF